jgi:hypothetical protein
MGACADVLRTEIHCKPYLPEIGLEGIRIQAVKCWPREAGMNCSMAGDYTTGQPGSLGRAKAGTQKPKPLRHMLMNPFALG